MFVHLYRGLAAPNKDKQKTRRVDNRLAAELGVKPLGDSELIQALKAPGAPPTSLRGEVIWMEMKKNVNVWMYGNEKNKCHGSTMYYKCVELLCLESIVYGCL